MDRLKRSISVFTSFEEENRAEDRRRIRMSTEQRLAEFDALLTRVRGPDWGLQPMVRTARVERVEW